MLKLEETSLLRYYRNKLENDPTNINLLITATKELIAKAKNDNSDLLFGNIESILMQYEKVVLSNDKLKIIYASVLQYRHAFNKAKKYLNKINSDEANLMRATIHQNLGEYVLASNECRKLVGVIDLLIASTCVVHARSYQGKLKQSYASLKKIEEFFSKIDKRNHSWTITALAEMAERLGYYDSSEKYYQQAHLLNPKNYHVISEWVDVLSIKNRHKEIIELLEHKYDDIRLNLRYQRALIATNFFDYSKHTVVLNKLREAIAIIELREDKRHYDTRAEYYLWINSNPEKALHWAKRNWSVSKIPKSARLLLLSANISNNMEAKNTVLDWYKINKIEDYVLRGLISRIVSHEVTI